MGIPVELLKQIYGDIQRDTEICINMQEYAEKCKGMRRDTDLKLISALFQKKSIEFEKKG